MIKKTFGWIFLLIFVILGCESHPIYTQVLNPAFMAHPPTSVQVEDPLKMLHTRFSEDAKSPIRIEVYYHCSACSAANAKAFGSDFDGYVRISIRDGSVLIARAQMDYKGKPNASSVQRVYDTLVQKLEWK